MAPAQAADDVDGELDAQAAAQNKSDKLTEETAEMGGQEYDEVDEQRLINEGKKSLVTFCRLAPRVLTLIIPPRVQDVEEEFAVPL